MARFVSRSFRPFRRPLSPRMLAIPALLALAACAPEGGGASDFELSTDGLEPLGDGFVYEGWLIVDDAPVSTGRFDIDDTAFSTSMSADDEDLAAATRFVLTIEPEPDADAAPSAVHVLGGPIVDGTADLTLGDEAALGADLAMAGGGYILETPTSAAIADDANQGIWFLDVSSGAPEAALDLPVLAAGWTYEGWVVVDGTPISTGTFTDPAAADSDAGGPAAGPDGGPPFPGQDFVDPATDLIGATPVISVEPVPDDSPAPFAIKPLAGPAVADAGAGVLQSLNFNAGGLPTGLVVIP